MLFGGMGNGVETPWHEDEGGRLWGLSVVFVFWGLGGFRISDWRRGDRPQTYNPNPTT